MNGEKYNKNRQQRANWMYPKSQLIWTSEEMESMEGSKLGIAPNAHGLG